MFLFSVTSPAFLGNFIVISPYLAIFVWLTYVNMILSFCPDGSADSQQMPSSSKASTWN